EPHPYYAKGPNGPAGLRVKNETPQLIRLSAKLLSNILSTFTVTLIAEQRLGQLNIIYVYLNPPTHRFSLKA
ncbi:hypothetical protein, partial [Lewinella sp. JB7]|uniref:hypothetical protein n=1 Tax=Lewinella sp. JB7 TaxID=2962887 RepID=UPI0020C9B3CD